MAVAIENKRYTDEDVLNKLPHPVRLSVRKRRDGKKVAGKKPKEEISEEFMILAGMFRVEQEGIKEGLQEY
jgi:hypothetical protein